MHIIIWAYYFLKSNIFASLVILCLGVAGVRFAQTVVFDSDEKFADSQSEILFSWNKFYTEIESTDQYANPTTSARFIYVLNFCALKIAQSTTGSNTEEYKYIKNIAEDDKLERIIKADYCSIALNSAMAYTVKSMFQNRTPEYVKRINEFENRNLIKLSGKNLNADSIALYSQMATSMAKSVVEQFLPKVLIGPDSYKQLDSLYINFSCRNSASDSYEENLIGNRLSYESVLIDKMRIPYERLEPIEYSENKSSKFYKEAVEVYTISKHLNSENEWIAEFWSDDHPGVTFTPVTRWLAITNQIIDTEKPTFDVILDTYIRLSLSLNETVVMVWGDKYKYMGERPRGIIKRIIDETWEPLHPNPRFPAFPSGHSAFSAAACGVLEKIFGQDYEFTDYAHEGKKEFKSKPRHFKALKAMALENAYSRVFLGVHFRSDCEVGMKLGFRIAEHINHLHLAEKAQIDDHKVDNESLLN